MLLCPSPTYINRTIGIRLGTKDVGQKRPLKPKEVWNIRARLQIEARKRDLAMYLGIEVDDALIPRLFNQNPCAQSRSPMDTILHGRSVSFFQALQQ